MLHTLVVGLGRSGAGLHIPVLNRLRAAHPDGPFASHPIVACDPRPGQLTDHRVMVVADLAEAAARVPVERTVVHVCTPPADRTDTLAWLAARGFRHILVEKPLAVDTAQLEVIDELRARHHLDLVVVAHWLSADLTRRLRDIVDSGAFGALHSIAVDQDKPRFSRSLRAPGHPSAFDVEIPHSLGVVLRIAGDAVLTGAGEHDLRCAGRTVTRLGGAWLALRHLGGATTRIRSDLTSPIRRRRVVVRLDDAVVVGHFPVSEEDHHAQLSVSRAGQRERQVFRDDALAAFLLRTYEYFAGGPPDPLNDLRLHASVVRLLHEAKHLVGRAGPEVSRAR